MGRRWGRAPRSREPGQLFAGGGGPERGESGEGEAPDGRLRHCSCSPRCRHTDLSRGTTRTLAGRSLSNAEPSPEPAAPQVSCGGHPWERRESAAASPGGFHPDPPSPSPVPRRLRLSLQTCGWESRGCWLGLSGVSRGSGERGPQPGVGVGDSGYRLRGRRRGLPHPRARALQPGWNLSPLSTPPTPSFPPPLLNSPHSPRPLFLCFHCLVSQLLARWGVCPVRPPPSPPPRPLRGFPARTGTQLVAERAWHLPGRTCRAGGLAGTWLPGGPAALGPALPPRPPVLRLRLPSRVRRTTLPLRANASALAVVCEGRRT